MRDRFILSKGHSAGALYATLASRGFFPASLLDTYQQFDSALQGHPHRLKVPGIEHNTGALGHGLSVGCGLAAGLWLLYGEASPRVYVLMGDGELQEGSVWEAAMLAAHLRLGRLTAIVDRNRLQQGDDTESTVQLEDLAAKWRAFGWRVLQCDGHDVEQLSVTLDRSKENDLQASAIQCWTALEGLFGVVPCTAMSMMSNNLLPGACEVDVTGAVAMVILQLASGQPSALVGWNNNYRSEPDMGIIFHCSNLPKEMLQEPRMEYPPILASTLGQENTYGTISGRIRPGRFTFARISTDDLNGVVRAYTGEGEISDAPLRTFGGFGVVHVPNLQQLLRHICRHGFEHHVAINLSESGRAVAEALQLYFGWEVYHHGDNAAWAAE